MRIRKETSIPEDPSRAPIGNFGQSPPKSPRVLAPLDGSSDAIAGLESVLPLIKDIGFEVTLLHVVGGPGGRSPDDADLRRVRDALTKRGVSSLETRVEGDPAAEVLHIANEGNFELLVLTKRRSMGQWAFRGGVVGRAVRDAEVPLLITRPDFKPIQATRLLVALSGALRCERIIPDADFLAGRLGADVDLVTVSPSYLTGSRLVIHTLMPVRSDPRLYLKRMAARFTGGKGRIEPVGRWGTPAWEIVCHAQEREAGLILMTSSGRSGISRMFLGSVSHQVLRNAPCPVWLRRVPRENVGNDV